MNKLILFFGIFILFSCNKEKRYSTKLMKGETWSVESVTINGTESQIKGQWHVTSDVDIYDEVPQVHWTEGEQDAVFEWQFGDNGKKFQLNYLQLCEECTGADLDSLDHFTYGITGSYEVKRHRKKEMEFTSSSTIGHPGKEVVVKIKKQ